MKTLLGKRTTKVRRINPHRFSLMTAAEKRVAIAKDVLTRLAAREFIPKRGQYVSVINRQLNNALNQEEKRGDPDWSACSRYSKAAQKLHRASAQEMIESNKCAVCAKGALVCSMVANFNRASVKSVLPQIQSSDFYEAKIAKGLNNIFPKTMRDRMEDLFEGYWTDHGKSLQSIMENIVQNKGELTL